MMITVSTLYHTYSEYTFVWHTSLSVALSSFYNIPLFHAVSQLYFSHFLLSLKSIAYANVSAMT